MRSCSICSGHGVILLRDRETKVMDFISCQECIDFYKTKPTAERAAFYSESAIFMAEEAILQNQLDYPKDDPGDSARLRLF